MAAKVVHFLAATDNSDFLTSLCPLTVSQALAKGLQVHASSAMGGFSLKNELPVRCILRPHDLGGN